MRGSRVARDCVDTHWLLQRACTSTGPNVSPTSKHQPSHTQTSSKPQTLDTRVALHQYRTVPARLATAPPSHPRIPCITTVSDMLPSRLLRTRLPALRAALRSNNARPFSQTPITQAPVRVTKVEELAEQSAVRVTWDDEKTAKFHKKWLRDHCACPACQHPDTRQRQIDTASIPADPQLTSLAVSNEKGGIAIQWHGSVVRLPTDRLLARSIAHS